MNEYRVYLDVDYYVTVKADGVYVGSSLLMFYKKNESINEYVGQFYIENILGFVKI